MKKPRKPNPMIGPTNNGHDYLHAEHMFTKDAERLFDWAKRVLAWHRHLDALDRKRAQKAKGRKS